MSRITLRDLKQYRSICTELKEIAVETKASRVHDTVRGSDDEYPYIQHTMTVSGVPVDKDSTALHARKCHLEQQKRNIELFIDGIDDRLTRQIFELRYKEGLSCRQVAAQIHGGNTEENVRQICSRYMKKQK